MDTFFAKVSSDILEFTNSYHDLVICKIHDKQRYVEEPEKFFYTIIQKTNSTISASNIFIRNFHTHNEWKVSIYILLRSIMSDLIIAEHVINTAETNDLKKKLIFKIYLDHVARAYNSIDKTYGKIENLSEIKKEQLKHEFINQNQIYFDNSGKIIKPEDVSVDRIIRNIFSNKQAGKRYDFLKRAYKNYDYFSKYEHLGALSFNLLHEIYDKSKCQSDYFKIYECISICFSALINYCRAWDNLFDKEMIILEELHKQFLMNSPDKIPDT